jgi:peptidoglycan/LPS O-acetylase OafA/YrhL
MVEESFVVGKKRIVMTNGTDVFTITIRKRPWWFWALAALWLLLEFLLLQTAWASVVEGEPRAATITGITALVLAAAGVLLWLHREQSQKPGEPSGQPGDASTPVEPQAQS